MNIDFARRLRTLGKDEDGLALLEFGMSLPFFLGALMLGLEVANLMMAHQQVSRIASVTADLAARYRLSIDETDVDELLLGARLSSKNLDIDKHGRIIVSSITRNSKDDGHWIRWQRCAGELNEESIVGAEGDGEGTMAKAVPTIPGDMGTTMVIPSTSNVMVAEVVYDYQPLFSDALLGDMKIRYTSSFMARQLSLPTLTDTTGADKLTC